MKLTNKQRATIGAIITAIAAALVSFFGLESCGITRATITNPKDGSATTITITSNTSPVVSVPVDADVLNKTE